MKQDRRLNGWIMLAAIVGVLAGLTLLAAGGFVAIGGFAYPKVLGKIEDLEFFVLQEGIVNAQLKLFNNELLKPEFLTLALGGIAALVGLITLILAIVCLNYAKKHKVVRHRVALFIFTLISLGVAVCPALYLWFEFKYLTDNIKYVCYGVGGAYAFVGLCQLLGLVFGRSEKFMSNDNSKYAFSNSSIKNARADINNAPAQQEYVPQEYVAQSEYVPLSEETYITQDQQRATSQQPVRPAAPSIPQGGQARPTQPMRPAQPMGPRPAQPVRPTQPPMGPRPAQPARPVAGQQPVRPAQPIGVRPSQPMRPTQPMGARPAQPARSTQPSMGPRPAQPSAAGRAFCPKCGKMLAPGENVCSLCGYRPVK